MSVELLFRDLHQCAFRSTRNAGVITFSGSRDCRDAKDQWILIVPMDMAICLVHKDQEMTLNYGQMVMVPPCKAYWLYSADAQVNYLRLSIDLATLTSRIENPLERISLPAVVTHSDTDELKRLLAKLNDQFKTKSNSDWVCRLHLNAATQSLITDYLTSGLVNGELVLLPAGIPEWVVQARLLLERRYADPDLTIDKIAAELDVSTAHLHRQFKFFHGITPAQHLSKYRIASAVRLLSTNSKKSIASIHLRCGFRSRSQFYVAFSKQTGSSPADFHSQREQ